MVLVVLHTTALEVQPILALAVPVTRVQGGRSTQDLVGHAMMVPVGHATQVLAAALTVPKSVRPASSQSGKPGTTDATCGQLRHQVQ